MYVYIYINTQTQIHHFLSSFSICVISQQKGKKEGILGGKAINLSIDEKYAHKTW